MIEIDPNTLPGMPAPFWFVELFKGVGFFLHMIPMHLWFAGLPLAIISLLFGGPLAHRFSRRMFGQLPVFLALGVNFAIVPLLFLQTTYYKPFYTATILSAWFWLMIIPLFLFAYYLIYASSFSVKMVFADAPGKEKSKSFEKAKNPRDNQKSTPPKSDSPEKSGTSVKTPGKKRTVFFGFLAWVFLFCIGILLTHGFTLMGKPQLWVQIWEKTGVAGAASGWGQNFADPELWLRFAGMFGLALLTTAFWGVFDSHVLIRKSESPSVQEQNEAYRKWTRSLAARICWIGTLVSVSAFSYYFWMLDQKEEMGFLFQSPWCFLPISVLVFPFVQSFLLTQWNRGNSPGSILFWGIVFGEILILASYVATRQLIQNTEVGRFVRVDLIPESVQWEPLIAFLGVFALGLLVIFWIVRQLAICPPSQES